jgi:phosphonate transport system substrate-binding protein
LRQSRTGFTFPILSTGRQSKTNISLAVDSYSIFSFNYGGVPMKKIWMFLIITAMLSACGGEQPPEAAVDKPPTATLAKPTDTTVPPSDTPEPTAEPTETTAPTITPTLPPLGEEGNPIIWVIVSEGTDPAVFVPAIEQATNIIEERTGLAFEIQVLETFGQVVEMLCTGEAQLGNLDAFSYILAQERGCTSTVLTSERFEHSTYQGQILVRRESNINSIADLAGTTYCSRVPESRTSWIIPGLMMRAAGVDPENDLVEVIHCGDTEGIIKGLYNGTCDAGATYVDARLHYLDQFSGLLNVVDLLTHTILIPNVSLTFSPNLPIEIQESLEEVFVYLEIYEGGQVLRDLFFWEGLFERGDYLYDDLRITINAAGVSPESLVDR